MGSICRNELTFELQMCLTFIKKFKNLSIGGAVKYIKHIICFINDERRHTEQLYRFFLHYLTFLKHTLILLCLLQRHLSADFCTSFCLINIKRIISIIFS